jgi:site-specific DNA recombinase
VKAYHQERKRLAASAGANRSRLERRLTELGSQIDRLLDTIATGLGDPAVLGPKSTTLNEERKRLLAELAAAPPAPDVVTLHPALLAKYEQQLENLQEALAACIASGESEAATAMRCGL